MKIGHWTSNDKVAIHHKIYLFLKVKTVDNNILESMRGMKCNKRTFDCVDVTKCDGTDGTRCEVSHFVRPVIKLVMLSSP